MPLVNRKPRLPADRLQAWQAFLDCAGVIEAGRRQLLATLPTGRVEPSPVGIGAEGMRQALEDVSSWMDRWRVDELAGDWQDCRAAISESAAGLPRLRDVAASTNELEELLAAVSSVVSPLDAFAGAERAWRRRWRMPRGQP